MSGWNDYVNRRAYLLIPSCESRANERNETCAQVVRDLVRQVSLVDLVS
jgi:hypothetical protein